MMRILLVSHSPSDPNGGASRVYHLLEQGLRERGHTVKTLHWEDLQVGPAADKVVSRLLLPQAVSRRASKEDIASFDVIMSSSGMLYPLYRKWKGVRQRPLLVAHLHGSSFFDHQTRLNEAMRGHMSLSWIYRHVTGPLPVHWDAEGSRYADLTIAQNSRDMDLIAESTTNPVVIVPLTVHPEILAAGHSTVSPEEKDPYSLLWFGTWVERKGCYYVPNAFKAIVARHPQAKLSIWGTGMDERSLLNHFDPSLHARISSIPRISREQQVSEYARHSIVLFPSISEGFGFALLEAMSMGLAAVTTNSGLGCDWLEDRQNAIIIPPSSSVHLARGANLLIEENALRQRLAHRGQELARTFTFERMIDTYEATFEEHRRHRAR
jgi:glycosyltransferase involved in cell wall biosynthesis